MNTFNPELSLARLICAPLATVIRLTFASFFCLAIAGSETQTNKVFATPEEAVKALIAAASTKDQAALHSIFGPQASDLANPDRVQSTNELNTFTDAFRATNRLARLSETEYVLEVGQDLWPFPVPIVKKDNRWFFDSEAGKDELLARRIGQNEIFTLEVIRAYVDAQLAYATEDRDNDQVLEYAQRISSTEGKTDGLYWPFKLNGKESPLGPMVGDAQAEGYFTAKPASDAGPQPFHGYLFKILTRQDSHAPGGKFDYIINGNMIAGFALVAWPAEYGSSGVMTFMVNQQGRVYQKDLGEKTAEIVKNLSTYDPDSSWQISPD